MASTIKFSHDAMRAQNGHIDREHGEPKNKEIDPERTKLNYSFPMEHAGLKPFQYYKKLIGEKYLYGRGTKREKDAVTGFGWIVTLPSELAGSQQKERAFFEGVFNFIAEPYGRENVINNSVHYDEGGLPHIHVIVCPVTKLDHDVVQYKTRRTKQAVKLASGRYEYKHIHVDAKGKPVDENNPDTWVKLNNYARMSDYYNEKVDCNSVLNPIELRNFHQDLQNYLFHNSIEGKIITGKTGTNFTVQELKDFTAKTGLTINDVREMMVDNTSLLQSFVERVDRVTQLEEILQKKDVTIESMKEELLSKERSIDRTDRSAELAAKDEKIRELSRDISEKDQELSKATLRTAEMEKKLAEKEQFIEAILKDLQHAQARVTELEKQNDVVLSQSNKTTGWGTENSGWGKETSGWGTRTHSIDIDEEKTW